MPKSEEASPMVDDADRDARQEAELQKLQKELRRLEKDRDEWRRWQERDEKEYGVRIAVLEAELATYKAFVDRLLSIPASVNMAAKK